LLKAEIPEDVIVDATGFADTDDEAILEARRLYSDFLKKFKAETSEEAEKVRAAGGLFILGTERHESRRIDNQLRGRSGRQGDPGETRFYISMTDDIMRLFGSERVLGMMDSLGLEEDTPIDQKLLSNAIEQAQRKVESKNFQSRKSVLEYDDVMNMQRGIIYEQRRTVLDGESVRENIRSMLRDVVTTDVKSGYGSLDKLEDAAQADEILAPFRRMFLKPTDLTSDEIVGKIKADELIERLIALGEKAYDAKEAELGNMPGTDMPFMRELERVILLRVVDEYWMDHIDAMHELRQGVQLRAYAQTKPIDEYKREGYEMFEAMITGIKDEVVRRVFTARVRAEQTLERKSVAVNVSTDNVGGAKKQPVKKAKKIGPNEPCPCGKLRPNGLPMKYKDCCGRKA
ncbi:MAG: preprotein translocase subunit SecA, partial [Oscillospiraceae bacterium]|nr:preprotein translocase subunit SecA [Oscillospiraceae bacterium]